MSQLCCTVSFRSVYRWFLHAVYLAIALSRTVSSSLPFCFASAVCTKRTATVGVDYTAKRFKSYWNIHCGRDFKYESAMSLSTWAQLNIAALSCFKPGTESLLGGWTGGSFASCKIQCCCLWNWFFFLSKSVTRYKTFKIQALMSCDQLKQIILYLHPVFTFMWWEMCIQWPVFKSSHISVLFSTCFCIFKKSL